MKQHWVYRLFCDGDEKCYIGKTDNINDRLEQHRREARRRTSRTTLKRSWVIARGPENIKIEVLAGPFETKQQAFDEETRFIAEYRVTNITLVNDPRTKGGECPPDHTGVKRSRETIEKMSLAQKEAWKRPEVRENNRNARLGVKKSPESIEKMRQSRRGKKASEQAKKNMSEAWKKSEKSQAHMLKWQEAGRKAAAKPVLCVTTGTVYRTVHETIVSLKMCKRTLQKRLKDGKLWKGLLFKFVEKNS